MTEDKSSDQKNIARIYGAFAASLVILCFPAAAMQMLGSLLLLGVLAAGYICRMRADPESLTANHMSFVISTIWAASAFLGVGALAGGIWLYYTGDNTAIDAFAASVMNGIAPTEAGMNAVIHQYIGDNLMRLISTAVVTMGPGLVYVIYRLSRGLSRAMKGHRLPHPERWV